jgi:hypothetical protein
MKQIFDPKGNHKLVADDGRETEWATYQGITYLDGLVGCTDYDTFNGEKILSPEEFCKMITAGQKSSPNGSV